MLALLILRFRLAKEKPSREYQGKWDCDEEAYKNVANEQKPVTR